MKLLEKIFNKKSAVVLPYKAAQPDMREYFLLECWNQYGDLPDSLVPYVDLIKTKAEWEKLGFKIENNRYGQVRKLKIDNKYYSFIKVDISNGFEAIAMQTGKRLTHNRTHIETLMNRGCKSNEFIYLTN